MLSKWFYVSLLILMIQDINADTNYIDVTKYDMVYYDPSTRLGLKGQLEDVGRIPLSGVAFRGVECNCESLTCGCCTGVNITRFNFDRYACTNFTYYPDEFAIKFKLIMNEKIIFTNSIISAKNPPPFCVPFYVPFISFCVRFFDIYTSERNLHACMDFETLVVQWPVLVLHFDCVKIGTDGISWLKPEDNGSALQSVASKPEVNEPEVYDEVNFEDSTEPPNNQTSLTPEEENNIGQLKL